MAAAAAGAFPLALRHLLAAVHIKAARAVVGVALQREMAALAVRKPAYLAVAVPLVPVGLFLQHPAALALPTKAAAGAAAQMPQRLSVTEMPDREARAAEQPVVVAGASLLSPQTRAAALAALAAPVLSVFILGKVQHEIRNY